jgi:hypothetical protein
VFRSLLFDNAKARVHVGVGIRSPTASSRLTSRQHRLFSLLSYRSVCPISISGYDNIQTNRTMPVLEVTQLRLKRLSADSPQLLHILSDVRDKLQTKSQFYTCVQDPTTLYILGIWRDLKQHLDFLASPTRDEILGPQESFLEFQWSVHIEFEDMSSLPLDAPVLAIERLSVEEDYVGAVDQAAKRYVQHLQDNNPFRAAYGWRCDELFGSREVLIFSGCETVQAHVGFSTRQHDSEEKCSASISGHYKEVLVHHTKNLERK